MDVTIRASRLLAKLQLRITPAPDVAAMATRDLARYYALLGRERPGAVVSPDEACLIRDALPAYRAARRADAEATLATTVEAEGSEAAQTYGVDVPALVERLRGLGPVRLLAVVDLAERMDAAVRRGDSHGRERVRQEFGISG